MYAERPSTRIPGAVIWTRSAEPGTARILPDGCMDLIWGGTTFVAGPDTHAQLYQGRPDAALTGIRLPPGLMPSVLGVPAHTLRDQRVRLDEIWSGSAVRPLVDRLGSGSNAGAVLEDAVLARLRSAPPRDDARLREVVRLLRAGWRVGDVAFAVNLSERQLHRRSLDAFGYGPKTLARILRLGAAIDAASDGSPFADVAARFGYADQAHLARDVRSLAGVPLSELVDVRFIQDDEALAG